MYKFARLVLVLALSIPNIAFAVYFPNHFLELVEGGDTSKAEKLIESAMQTMIRQVQIPYVGSQGKLETTQFFEQMEKDFQKLSPGSRLYISGGVVRSLLGSIYKEVHLAKQKDPSISTEAALMAIIASTEHYPSTRYFGIGSDLDILFKRGEEDQDSSKEHELQLVKQLTDFINSAETKAGVTHFKFRLKKSIVAVGDIKPYQKQTDLTTDQGGSSLDWMALPFQGGQMVMPDDYRKVFSNFVLGIYSYYPPKIASSVRDTDKQTIRGLRVFLELPFLHPDEASKAQLILELQNILNHLEEGKPLSDDAFEQLDKLISNAQFGAAKNRFLNPEPGTPEFEIESLVLKLNVKLGKAPHGHPYIPEFISLSDISNRKGDACGLAALGFLLPTEEFFANFTDNGKLYHGTAFESILPIVRNGLYVSDDKQGTAAYGGGAYSSPKREVALGYGTPIELQVRRDVSIRALDWATLFKNSSFKEKLQSLDLDVDLFFTDFKKLSELCDLDFIVHEHVLIQNSGAIVLPQSVSDLIRLYADHLKGAVDTYLLSNQVPLSPAELNVLTNHLRRTIEDYRAFYTLGEYLGLKDIDLPDAVVSILIRGLENSRNEEAQLAFAKVLGDLKIVDPVLKDFFMRNYESHPSERFRAQMGAGLFKTYFEDSQILEKFLKDMMAHPSQLVRTELIVATGDIKSQNNAINQAIGKNLVSIILEEANPFTKVQAAKIFAQGFPLLEGQEESLKKVNLVLLGLAKNGEIGVRLGVFEVFASGVFKKYYSKKTYTLLTDTLENDPLNEIRIAAGKSLIASFKFALNRDQVESALVLAIRKQPSIEIRVSLINALADLPEFSEAILRELCTDDPQPEEISKAQNSTATAWRMYHKKALVMGGLKWLSSPEQQPERLLNLSAQILVASDLRNTEEAQLAFLEGMLHSSPTVQQSCEVGLGRVSYQKVADRLIELFELKKNSPNSLIRLASAARAIGSKDPRVVTALLDQLEASDITVSASAVWPIRLLYPMPEFALDRLVRIVSDSKNQEARRHAASLLQTTTQKTAKIKSTLFKYYVDTIDLIFEEAKDNFWAVSELDSRITIGLELMSDDLVFQDFIRMFYSTGEEQRKARKWFKTISKDFKSWIPEKYVNQWNTWINHPREISISELFKKEDLEILSPLLYEEVKAAWKNCLAPEF